MALIQPTMEVLTKRTSSVEDIRVEQNAAVQGEDFDQKSGSSTPTQTSEENRSKSPSQGPRDSIINNQASYAYASERSPMDATPKPPSSSSPKDLNTSIKEDQLETTRAEVGAVREENDRLKSVLAQILKDYESLRSQLANAIRSSQEQAKKTGADQSCCTSDPLREKEMEEEEEELELVSLCLGTSSTGQTKKGGNVVRRQPTNTSGSKTITDVDGTITNERLTLGLDCRFDERSSCSAAAVQVQPAQSKLSAPEASEEAAEPWPPSKILKTATSRSADDEVSQQVHVKKARVSVRARCDAPTMSDGCQWRKYGQKISKGNPCPRAYYRCTVAPACPVRKQVQRCSDDMSILITTYEGTHNHPLPMAATAMASTTSAAANMLLSGSSTATGPGMAAPLAAPSSTAGAASQNGLNFNISADHNNNSVIPRQQQHYFPPNPAAIAAASPHHPTITLDLTPPASSSSSPRAINPTTQQFVNRPSTFSANFGSPSTTTPRYTSTNFNFSSMDSSSTMPAASPWGNTSSNNGYLGYGSQLYNNATTTTNSRSNIAGSTPYAQKNASAAAQKGNALTDTIAKAITTDPSFQSALAAAITSIVAEGGGQAKEGGGISEGLVQSLKWCGSSVSSSNITTSGSGGPNGSSTGSAASYMNRSVNGDGSPQQGNLSFLQTSLGFGFAKNNPAGAPPFETRDRMI